MTDFEVMVGLLDKAKVMSAAHTEFENNTLQPSGNTIVWMYDDDGIAYAHFTFGPDGTIQDGGKVIR